MSLLSSLTLALAVFVGDTSGVRVVGREATETNLRAVPAKSAAATDVGADDAAAPGAAAWKDIAWESAPRVGARVRLAIDPAAGARVLATADGAPFFVLLPHGAVLAADLDDPSNAALRRWGYLPFVLHAAAEHAAGRGPPRFARWPAAPVPHRPLVTLWLTIVAALATLLAAGFAAARRAARRHPDAHLHFFDRLSTPRSAAGAGWTRPGIARPLGGFFMFISATLLAMGPYLYVTAVLVPSRVQPFPDADGAWSPIEDLATFAWTLVDLGMTAAFVRSFAAHRVDAPARALAAAQLWIWWQLLGGLVILTVGGALACGVLPHTHLALFSRVVLLRAVLQVPGIFSFFTLFFQAAQRFDFQLLLDLLEKRLLFVACPIPFILWLRAVGRAHPQLGESFGALCGIAAGQYTALILTAVIGFSLYRRLRLPLRPVMQASFDRKSVAEMLRYGLGITAGKAPYFAANATEFAIIALRLPGYVSWLGIRNLIMARLVFTVQFVLPFMDSAVPAIAEALTAGKRALARYYIIRYLQFGLLFVALVVAVLLGAGRPLVLYALSPEWRPAATYLPHACAFALFLPAGWLAGSIFKGAGRPGVDAAILIGEQIARITLIWLLLPSLGFAGIFVAMLGGIALRLTVAWTTIHRRVLTVTLWPWSSVLAPLASGALVYAAIVGAAAWLPATRAAAIALFAAAALFAFPAGFFVIGAIGGLDPAAVDDLRRAAELSSAMRPIARLLARAGAAGARLVPRALPPLAAEAQAEADAIVRVERPAPDAPR